MSASRADRIKEKLQKQRDNETDASKTEVVGKITDVVSGITLEPSQDSTVSQEQNNDVSDKNGIDNRLYVNESSNSLNNMNTIQKETMQTNNINNIVEDKSVAAYSFPSAVRIVETIRNNAAHKLTKAQTHKRQTYEIRNDLIEKLDEYARSQPRGFKGELINLLLEDFFENL